MQQGLSCTSIVSLSMYFVILNHVWARGVVNWPRTEWKGLSSVMVGGARDHEAAHAVGVPLGHGWKSHKIHPFSRRAGWKSGDECLALPWGGK